MRHEFPKMAEFIAEQTKDGVELSHITIDADVIHRSQVKTSLLGVRAWYHDGSEPGTYLRLLVDGKIVMSDSWMERYTNQEILERANGKVLIVGLGIGMILTLLPKKESVEHITVLEQNQTVIDLVSPYYDDPKITTIQGDVFTWETLDKFDTIYFDIWSKIDPDNYAETITLHKRYQKNLNRKNPKRYMGSWMRKEFKRLRNIRY